MKLDFSPLEKAILQLEKSLRFFHSELAEDIDLREQFRNATIQAFEFTFELACKMIKRQLTEIVVNPTQLNEMYFRDLMRLAADAGIIRDVSAYMRYRQARNDTSHAYDDKKADRTAAIAGEFVSDARILLKDLEKSNEIY